MTPLSFMTFVSAAHPYATALLLVSVVVLGYIALQERRGRLACDRAMTAVRADMAAQAVIVAALQHKVDNPDAQVARAQRFTDEMEERWVREHVRGNRLVKKISDLLAQLDEKAREAHALKEALASVLNNALPDASGNPEGGA